jgi:glycosyltransferase involved in cell wall biosynthesis
MGGRRVASPAGALMRIGFDVSQTGAGKAGCGYVADALIQALAENDPESDYLLYPFFGADFHDPDALRATRTIDRANCRVVSVARSVSGALDFWRSFPADGEYLLGAPDIVHANNFYCPVEIRNARIVYTLHDVSFLEHPEFTTEANRWICFRGVFDAAVHADLVLAVSDSSRDRFLHFFPGFPRERIRVFPLASRFSGDATTARPAPPDGLEVGKFWLTVGTLEPRKNLRRLLSAYAAFRRESGGAFPLVLAGGKGWMEGDLAGFIEDLGISDAVHVLGYVPDSVLRDLYRACFAFVYPSLYEGFGLPVLEAMSLGAPVITSDVTSLPEVAGNAAIFVDPRDEASIAAALKHLAENAETRRDFSERARERSRGYSWKRSAETVLDAYREVLDRPKRDNST